MGLQFTSNPRFLEELAAAPETKSVLRERAEKAFETFVDAVPREVGIWAEKAYVDDNEIGTTSSLWALMEYGSVNNPPFAPFRRAVEAAGLDMTDPDR